jgi:acetyl esterase/lipase
MALIQFRSVRCLVWFFTLSLAAGISAAPLDKDGIPYAHPGGKTLLLRLHVPDGTGPFPAAVLVHGGGFDEGDRNRFIVRAAPALRGSVSITVWDLSFTSRMQRLT